MSTHGLTLIMIEHGIALYWLYHITFTFTFIAPFSHILYNFKILLINSLNTGSLGYILNIT